MRNVNVKSMCIFNKSNSINILKLNLFLALLFLLLLFLFPASAAKADSTLLYQENFDSGAAVDWQEISNPGAIWQIIDGKYYLKIPSCRLGAQSVYQNGFSWDNYVFSFDAELNDGVDRVIFFRWQNNQNYYSLGLRGFWRYAPNDTPVIYLAKCYQGQCTGHQYYQYFAAYHFSDKSALNNETARIDIEAAGNKIKIFYNDELVIDWQEITENYPKSGTIGFYGWSGDYGVVDAAWDNVMVKTIKEEKEVPLYTQVRSPYPSDVLTAQWTNIDYADGGIGVYSCAKNTNATIARCGCAITSIVMIARYYDITEAQGQDVNPGKINEWLKNNNGYQNGNVNWIAGARYTDWRITYAKTDKSIDNYALLDQYLNQDNPVIAKANVGRGGINRQHFFVIDNILASTYGVKDPAWYNTKTLNETTDTGNHIRGYENGFDGLRIYKKGNGIAQSAIIIVLGSPAELLITDSSGRKLGKDASGIEYGEIPNAWYFEDGFDDPTGENPPVDENNKIIQILEPMDGEYKLEVIGTGQGDYSLDANFYDTQGNANNKSFQSETAVGYTAQYNISFNSSDSTNNIIESTDEIPPEAEIYFNPNTQELEIKGVDSITVNPVVSVVENIDGQTIYQIQDEVGNATKLYFDGTKQKGKQIKIELKSVQYNDGAVINLPKIDLKYEWSLNKDGVVKELNQRIKVEGQFDIKAKYNHQKNETEIKIKLQNQEEQRQIFPGIKIIKLITGSGKLNFGYVE